MSRTAIAKAKAPLPDALPGAFFVLEWDRDAELFKLHVDDEFQSSYNLGERIEPVRCLFDRWGCKDVGDRAIDMAKEFGASQAIPDQDRVIALFDRRPQPDPLKESTGHACYLP